MKLYFPIGLLFFTGCLAGPDYVPPDTQVLPQFAGQTSDMQLAEVDKEWWKSFHDPDLDRLIEESVYGSKNLDAAISRINQARALAKREYLDLVPQTQGSSEYTKSRASASRFPGSQSRSFAYEIYSLGLESVWELDVFGRVRRRVEGKEAESEAAVFNVQDLIRVLVAEVAGTYFQMRGFQHRLDVANQNLQNQRETLGLVEAKERAGQTSPLDTARARAQYVETQATIPTLEAALKSAVFRLGVLAGRPPVTYVSLLEGKKPVPRYGGPLQIGRPGEILRRRPDIRARERLVAAANAQVGAAVGEYFPKLSLFGSLGVEATSPDEWFKGDTAYSIGPRLVWTGFNVQSIQALVESADAATKEAVAEYDQTVLVALEEVESALVRCAKEQERKGYLVSAVEMSDRVYELASVQYSQGVSDFLTVLDAQRGLLKNQGDLAASEADLAIAMVALYKALGSGWEKFEVE